MNARIQELAEQALDYTYEQSKLIDVTSDWWGATYSSKFAELIVKEAISLAQSHCSQVGDFAAGIDYVRDQLIEHFGAETDDEVEYCPACNAEWSGTSCGLDNCGWIVGVE